MEEYFNYLFLSALLLSEPLLATDQGASIAVSTITSESSTDATAPVIPDDHETLPKDLSPLGMYLAADWVVKSVILSLLFASFLTA